MTLTLRNSIVLVFLLIVTLFFLLYVGFIVYLAAGFPRSVFTGDLYKTTETTQSVAELLITFGIYFLFALGAGFVLKTFFRKTTSPEIFFFIMYILSVAFRGLSCFQVFFILKAMPSSYGVTLTKLFVFGEVLGAGCLLSSGIFPTGIRTTKYGIYLLLVILVAVIMASSIPVDSTSLKSNLLYSIGNKKEYTAVLIIIKFLAVGNYCIAGFFKNNRDYFFLGLALLLTIIGADVIGLFDSWMLTAVGFAALCVGTFLYANRIHSLYMWQ